MEIKLGDVVRLKKLHPCGSDRWQVVRLGADIGIRCQGCQHRVLLERGVFERRVKGFIARGDENRSASHGERRQETEARLADLKARWPQHSVPPAMWLQLEELEDELKTLENEEPDER